MALHSTVGFRHVKSLWKSEWLARWNKEVSLLHFVLHMSETHRACFRDHATFWNKIKPSLAPRFKKSISNSQRCDEGWFSRFSIALFDHDIFHLYSALWLVMWFSYIVFLLPLGVKLDFIIHSHLTFFQLGCQNQITTHKPLVLSCSPQLQAFLVLLHLWKDRTY